MTSNKFTAAGAGAAAALIFASTAFAQAQPTRPAVPAAAAVSHGATLPGVCLMSGSRALLASDVGKHVQTRMQQIVTQVNSELQAEKTAIDNEAKTLDTQKATMDQSALEKRAADLQVRFNAWQRKGALRQREAEATEQKALGRVRQELDPVIKAAYVQRACSVLLERDAVMLANPAMDITDAVIAGLNARIKTFAFDRERLDTQPAAAAPRTQ